MSEQADRLPDPRRIVAIVVAAGRGTRVGAGVSKQFRNLLGRPLLAWTLDRLGSVPGIHKLVLVVRDPHEARLRLSSHLPSELPLHFASGAETRQGSTLAGLAAAGEVDIVLVHDGVRPFITKELVERVSREAAASGAAVPVIPLRETLKRHLPRSAGLETLDRSQFALAQTPQGFRREVLAEALRRAQSEGYVGTDEAELVERMGQPVTPVEGLSGNLKITTPEDFRFAEALMEKEQRGEIEGGVRVGLGYDIHPLVQGRPLRLGGVEIPHPMGLGGHSDGDLVCHAAIDAVLGAAGLGDIGQLFPDTDARYRGAAGLDLMVEVGRRVREAGYRIINLDVVVVAEEPQITPHREEMRSRLARALGCSTSRIGIKGKRGEGLGPTGRKEAMEAQAVALLHRDGANRGSIR